MNCEEIGLMLVEPEAAEVRRDEIAAHLATCLPCQGNAGYLRWLAKELTGLPHLEAPVSLSQIVLAEVGRERRRAAGDSREVAFSAFALPLGTLYVAYGEKGIVRTGFAMAETDFATLLAGDGYRARLEEQAPRRVAGAVSAFAQRGRAPAESFDLSRLGPFQRAVLEKALTIPRGEVRSYSWIAREIGKPGASRAVGNALGRNPVPVLIPCHRALRGNGTLGGYALGLEMKKRLLAAEAVDLEALARDARAGVRFHASRTTGIFCLPTCHHARRIEPANRVPLRSEKEALDGGFRPCKVCRPASATAVA